MTKKNPATSRASSMAGSSTRLRSSASTRKFLISNASKPSPTQMRELIEDLWPELVNKLPPKAT